MQPTKYIDKPFPADFKKHIQKIFQRMFRVHAHIYYSHFKKVTELGAEAHLNSCFKHFIFFVLEFKLVSESEMAPLAELIENLKQRDAERRSSNIMIKTNSVMDSPRETNKEDSHHDNEVVINTEGPPSSSAPTTVTKPVSESVGGGTTTVSDASAATDQFTNSTAGMLNGVVASDNVRVSLKAPQAPSVMATEVPVIADSKIQTKKEDSCCIII